MAKPETPRGPGKPRVRAGFYGMAALYLAYLYYQLAKPFFRGDPAGPPLLAFGLGTVVLGGGAVVLGLLAWKMYRAPEERTARRTAAIQPRSSLRSRSGVLGLLDFEKDLQRILRAYGEGAGRRVETSSGSYAFSHPSGK